MINKIHEVGFDYDGIVLNAGAYTHTSIALQYIGNLIYIEIYKLISVGN